MLLITFLRWETLYFCVIAQKNRMQFNHLQEYSVLKANEIGGGLTTSKLSLTY